MSAEVFVSGPGEGTLAGGRGPLVKAFGDRSGSWAVIERGLHEVVSRYDSAFA